MALLYRKYQNNNSRSNQYKKWYGKSVMLGTVETRQIAEIIQANCTVKKSDVLAVLDELVEVMKQKLQESYRVKLNGFGSFKLGLKTSPADTAKEFTPSANVKDVHVNFQPELTIDQTGKRSKVFVTGCKVAEASEYSTETTTEEEEGGV